MFSVTREIIKDGGGYKGCDHDRNFLCRLRTLLHIRFFEALN
jgi:hypothetical protein